MIIPLFGYYVFVGFGILANGYSTPLEFLYFLSFSFLFWGQSQTGIVIPWDSFTLFAFFLVLVVLLFLFVAFSRLLKP